MRTSRIIPVLIPILVGVGLVSSPSGEHETSVKAETAISSSAGSMASLLPVGADAAIPLPPAGGFSGGINLVIGGDKNGADNPFIQPQSPELAGGGRDQTQQFTDILFGDIYSYNVMNGRLGDDILVGGFWQDVIVGGLEHFNSINRDKAFGNAGNDFFLWKPGDGSDRFDGGPGLDTVVFGVVGEVDPTGAVTFNVVNDQAAGELWIDPILCLPRVDVTNSPGFCKVIDNSTSPTAWQELRDLDAHHLVQFIIRGVNNAFNTGAQNTDNGLRVTLTLRDVEFLVCTNQAGGAIEAFDLRTSPPTPVALSSVPFPIQFMVQ